MDLSVTGVDAATNKFCVETILFDLAFESMQTLTQINLEPYKMFSVQAFPYPVQAFVPKVSMRFSQGMWH